MERPDLSLLATRLTGNKSHTSGIQTGRRHQDVQRDTHQRASVNLHKTHTPIRRQQKREGQHASHPRHDERIKDGLSGGLNHNAPEEQHLVTGIMAAATAGAQAQEDAGDGGGEADGDEAEAEDLVVGDEDGGEGEELDGEDDVDYAGGVVEGC